MPGATAVGITYDNGVVIASEKRIAYGNFLVSKSTKKTFQLTPYVGAACAGLVADMQILSLQISALAKIRKMEIKREIWKDAEPLNASTFLCKGSRRRSNKRFI